MLIGRPALAPHVDRVDLDALILGLVPDLDLAAVGKRTCVVEARGDAVVLVTTGVGETAA